MAYLLAKVRAEKVFFQKSTGSIRAEPVVDQIMDKICLLICNSAFHFLILFLTIFQNYP